MTTEQPWPWPESMDSLLAAPTSHRVLLDNNQMRVLEAVIEPGTREPEHAHQAPSVMIVDGPAPIRYYQGGTLLVKSQAPPGSRPGVCVHWLEPECPHSVENTDQRRYHAIRVELKYREASPGRGTRTRAAGPKELRNVIFWYPAPAAVDQWSRPLLRAGTPGTPTACQGCAGQRQHAPGSGAGCRRRSRR
jgi:hypothetical protein